MTDHEKWMEQAFREAEKAFNKDEVPVGAVVVYENKIIGRGHNLVETLQDPTAHAEMLAITAAANYLASWRLEEAFLYVTLEPCPMCAGAIYLSRIPNLIYGASDPRMGAFGSVVNWASLEKLNHKITVVSGVMEAQCAGILQSFFEKLRNEG
ncbi:MAG: tRNA adenosine(34) deaminase TadA [candidate division KSB1 bacterium]|nr:tRNA adenosine(34) deaminase TadA [candidate division KSB1 bacterium]